MISAGAPAGPGSRRSLGALDTDPVSHWAYGDAMRVVGGALGGRRLAAADGIRPTSDRAREAIFNMLASMQLPEGATALDLFAGTGALGIEALSRGATHVTFVDSGSSAHEAISTNLAQLGVAGLAKVVRSDAIRYLTGDGGAGGARFDIVFADPPYLFDGWAELLASVVADVVVCESDREITEPHWQTYRVRRYGTPVVTVLLRDDE